MKEPNLQNRLWSWLLLAVAFVVVGNVVWELAKPLIVPGCGLIIVGVVAAIGYRYWRSRHFW